MFSVRTKNALTKKELAKQLVDIEAEQRAAQARLEREVTSLGNDLDRINRSTKDMSTTMPEHSRLSSRRGSLPLLSPSDFPTTPRSVGRRASVAAVSLSGSTTPRSILSLRSLSVDDKDIKGTDDSVGPNMTLGSEEKSAVNSKRRSSQGTVTKSNDISNGKSKMAAVESHRSSSAKSNASHKSDSKRHTSNSSHLAQGGKDTPRPLVKRNSVSHVVHQDEDEILLKNLAEKQPNAENSMFALHSRRRASEPDIGGHMLRHLQQKAEELADTESDDNSTDDKQPHPHLGPENEAMKKAIESQLPSNIVTEEDEEGLEDEENGTENSEEKSGNVKSPRKSRNNGPRAVKSAAAGKQTIRHSQGEQDSNQKSKTGSSDSGVSEAVQTEDINARAEEKIKSKINAVKQRRRSDGEVLKFAKVWRLQTVDKSKAGGKDKELPAKEEEEFKRTPMSDVVWDAVRKCRYIRGYEPPDMNQPEDLGEFVFGHRMPDAE